MPTLQYVASVDRSDPLRRALGTSRADNSANLTFANPQTQVADPGDPLKVDGSYVAGVFGDGNVGGQYQRSLCKVLPLGDQQGRSFSLRLYGWTLVMHGVKVYQAWVPQLLCELACTTGQAKGTPDAVVRESDFFCDTLAVTQGSLGNFGELFSPATGVVAPTTDLIGYAIIALRGCQYIQFDFQQTDAVTMNALWSFI